MHKNFIRNECLYWHELKVHFACDVDMLLLCVDKMGYISNLLSLLLLTLSSTTISQRYLERGIGPSMPTWGQPKCHSYSQWLWNCGEFLIIIRFVRYLPLLWNHVFVWDRLLYNFLLALYHGLWDNRKRTHWKCIFLQKESTWQTIQTLWRWGQNQNNELKKFWSWYISISFLLFVCIFLRQP